MLRGGSIPARRDCAAVGSGYEATPEGGGVVEPARTRRTRLNSSPFNLSPVGRVPVSQPCISVSRKLTTYHGYREQVLSQWLAAGKKWERPRFRVVFLTQSIERAHHILSLAAETTRNKSRRLVYAATLESYITADDPLHTPLLLDHRGEWQSIVDLHPTASYRKTPVRLARPLESPLGVC